MIEDASEARLTGIIVKDKSPHPVFGSAAWKTRYHISFGVDVFTKLKEKLHIIGTEKALLLP